jgi:hypothetical protein
MPTLVGEAALPRTNARPHTTHTRTTTSKPRQQPASRCRHDSHPARPSQQKDRPLSAWDNPHPASQPRRPRPPSRKQHVDLVPKPLHQSTTTPSIGNKYDVATGAQPLAPSTPSQVISPAATPANHYALTANTSNSSASSASESARYAPNHAPAQQTNATPLSAAPDARKLAHQNEETPSSGTSPTQPPDPPSAHSALGERRRTPHQTLHTHLTNSTKTPSRTGQDHAHPYATPIKQQPVTPAASHPLAATPATNDHHDKFAHDTFPQWTHRRWLHTFMTGNFTN